MRNILMIVLSALALVVVADEPKLVARTFVLKYAKATEVAQSLNEMCARLKVPEAAVAFPESHTVAVSGERDIVEMCAKIVSEVDRKPKQVYIEARFFDLLALEGAEIGFDWSTLYNSQLGVAGTADFGYTGGHGADVKGNAVKPGQVFTGTLSAKGLQVALNAFRMNEESRVLANPRVVVASGKRAIVDISTKRPNVIVAAKRTNGSGEKYNLDVDAQIKVIPGTDKEMFAGEAFFWWGIGLTVEPYVAEDGIITARIVPNVSNLSDIGVQEEGAYVKVVPSSGTQDQMPTSQFPIIDVKRIETEFSLRSGETAVIGGMARTEWYDCDDGIPYLSKIWGLKWLFGHTKKAMRQREIVVLVTMGLVDPIEPDKKAGLPKNSILARDFVDGKEKEPGDMTEEEINEALDRARKVIPQ